MLIAFHQKVLSDRPFDALSAKHNHRWAAILQARAESQERQNSLKTLLGQIAGEVRPDMNFVVFGSLARGEWTAKSDIDWSLLVDGQADPADSQTARRIEGILVREKWKEP